MNMAFLNCSHRARSFLMLLIFLLASGICSAQIFRIPITVHSDRNQSLPIRGLLPSANASTAFLDFGVYFGDSQSTPIIVERVIPLVPPLLESRIQNLPNSGDSSGKPFHIHFVRPVRRVFMTVHEGLTFVPGHVATFSFWSPSGEFLGEVALEEPEWVGFPLGFETSHPDGIGRFSIDLGDAPQAEELNQFSFEFVDLPSTRAYLPQIAAVTIGNRRLVTRLVVENRSQREARLHFRGSNGEVLAVPIAGEDVNSITIPATESRSVLIEPPGDGSALQGYAILESDRRFVYLRAEMLVQEGEGAATTGLDGPPTAEVARLLIPAVWPQSYHLFAVQRNADLGITTGIAFVNPSDGPVTIEFAFAGDSSSRPTGLQHPGRVTLEPFAQFTFLIEQFCSLFKDQFGDPVCEDGEVLTRQQFETLFGTRSTGPIAVSVIQTRGGWPATAVPVRTYSSTFLSSAGARE